MRWTVYSDAYMVYDQRLDASGYRITDAELNLALNKTGSFHFTIYPDNPSFDLVKKLSSIITVYNDNTLYFRGRALNETVGFFNERKIECEGELAYLLDTIQRPYKFPAADSDPATPAAFLQFLLAQHNAQVPDSHKFLLGNVTVADPNNYIARSDTQYSTTWEIINEGLLDTHGGYLHVRHEADGNYLDYLADFSTLSNQPVEFGGNLLDITTDRSGAEIATAILPLGDKDDDKNCVTIATLADSTSADICKSGDIVYSKAAETLYGGRIVKVVKWDDVTEPSNLLAKATAELAKIVTQPSTVEISAADLAAAGYDYNSFNVGTYVTIHDTKHVTAHNLSSTYLVASLSINLLDPAANKLTVGATTAGFSEKNQKQQAESIKTVQKSIEKNQSIAIAELEQRTTSSIQQSSEKIMSNVSDQYYSKGTTDQLISSVSTQITQNAEQIDIKFNKLQQDADAVQAGNDAQFTQISKYIRFSDGNILLGEEGNELTLKIQNDRISFLQGMLEVAYFSNQKLYVTDGNFLNSLQLGKFAFFPRANGNLSMKKVVD